MNHYVNNASLRVEITKSKATYCSYIDDAYVTPQAFITKLDEVVDEGVTYRLATFAHIPKAEGKAKKSKIAGADGEVQLIFSPFQHYILRDGEPLCVGKSHWQGGLANGWFSQTHGKITNTHGRLLMLMAERYCRRSNLNGYSYRDEIYANGIAQLVHAALKFDEAKSDNPFAFYTTTLRNASLKVLNDERKQRDIRDDLLTEAGVMPSDTRQNEEALNRREAKKPDKPPARRSRPPLVKHDEAPQTSS